MFIEAALNNTPPIINGDGNTSRDFTFVENAVQANIKALLSDNISTNEVINIAYGVRTTLNELWQGIGENLGIEIEPVYKDERAGDVKHSLASIQRAARLINYDPQFDIKQGLEIAIAYYVSLKK